MSLLDTPIARLDGTPATLGEITGGRPALLVNVASKCGLTPQYSALEQLQETYGDRLTVVGLPCNQFGGQEPGSSEEIAEFCSATYGVSFPLTEKVEVNGEGRHAVYEQLVGQAYADDGGFKKSTEPGDVQWNFEKFVVAADGSVVARFGPATTPDDPAVVAALEGVLG
ncbi:glutathione peroxidase [Nocardioides alkalitolerans]|uniref:glutathione peroxidase n=1 Tax=Nocardioides alkalitolerans TaxID=281714 RepID=UPI0003FAEFE1|nr:glutathione peroxidase [Nocardioides alkalitolerans]